MKIRLVEPEDYLAMREIYAQYIDTTITFEYVLPSIIDFNERFNSLIEDYPCLVAIEGNRIVGYAYAHAFASRAGYNWSAELSIYLDTTKHQVGLGRKLYEALIELVRLQGVRTVYGIVAEGNIASERFHEKLGFEQTAYLKNVGFKNGRWLACAYYQKSLLAYVEQPTPILKVNQLEPSKVKKVVEHVT